MTHEELVELKTLQADLIKKKKSWADERNYH